jgi:RNA-binding protein YlmH
MSDTVKREFEELYARLEDIKGCAVRGELGISAFLSPRELHYGEEYLKRSGTEFFSFGGYADAERRKIYVLPDYMEGAMPNTLGDFGFSSDIVALMLKGSGFERLSHRMVMGSLLGLGIDRSVVGDIVMLDEYSAVVICEHTMAQFLCMSWEKVGRDKIKLSVTELKEDFFPRREYEPISDTVASARLDCVIASICRLSREKAREAVIGKLVEVDHECREQPDREVVTPAIISVRGYGKFRIVSLSDKTKKGRYRLLAEKFL